MIEKYDFQMLVEFVKDYVMFFCNFGFESLSEN